ncbi:hypothetical protein PR003_g29483 [Phytophthora rubi]|uniref:HTH psq-type domain-containing protein n=1 Tax=Phytophthora rubi TaxID=129364 RepID=A0A6A4BR79_9STRA|nr:hypothetical protein PR003_g29483 [Phytophthora rubi]
MPKTCTIETKLAAVAQVEGGRTADAVATATGVHERTIRKWVVAAAQGGLRSTSRPGPKPFFPDRAERHIYDWAVGRQLVGHPVGRSAIIQNAQEMALLACGRSVGGGGIDSLWGDFPSLRGDRPRCYH